MSEISTKTYLVRAGSAGVTRHFDGGPFHPWNQWTLHEVTSRSSREARRLAESGNLLVKEIAAMTGFDDPKYFCRTYRAYFGHTPSHTVMSRRTPTP